MAFTMSERAASVWTLVTTLGAANLSKRKGEEVSPMSNPAMAVPTTAPLDPGHLASLRAALDAEGAQAFARRSRASVQAVLRAAAGLPVRAGTVAIVVAALKVQP